MGLAFLEVLLSLKTATITGVSPTGCRDEGCRALTPYLGLPVGLPDRVMTRECTPRFRMAPAGGVPSPVAALLGSLPR